MSKRLSFLKSIWGEFSLHSTGNFPSRWVSMLVSERVLNKLGEFTTLDELIKHCESEDVVNECFDIAISALNRDWAQIQPKIKRELTKSIKAYKLQKYFNVELQLTEDEERELRIRWDISDILYSEKKKEAFSECKSWGIDIERRIELDVPHGLVERVNNCTKILNELLRNKLDIDLAVVSIAEPTAVEKYNDKVTSRLKSEYLYILESFREALIKGTTDIFYPDGRVTRGQDFDIVRNIEWHLGPFKENFEILSSGISKAQPSPAVYSQARELIGRNDDIFVKNMHQTGASAMNIVISIVILGFALAGFLFLSSFAAVLWLIFFIAAYPLALSFTKAGPIDNANLVELYKSGVAQIPVIGKYFHRFM